MKISIGADHGGVELRRCLIRQLGEAGHQVIDRGADTEKSADYPDFANAVCADLAAGRAERGVLVCKTGIGMSMAANKFPGIRAALVQFEEDARMSRSHNDANVIAFSAQRLAPEQAAKYLRIFLETPFEGGRHQRRIDKMENIPKKQPDR